MTEKRPGPTPGVRLIELSVKRELAVFSTDPGLGPEAHATSAFFPRPFSCWVESHESCTDGIRRRIVQDGRV